MESWSPGADALRSQLLDGLPARVQGMAEALLLEWEAAITAVPQLAHVASSELIALLRMDAGEREAVIRQRWDRSIDVEREVELLGGPRRPPSPRLAISPPDARGSASA